MRINSSQGTKSEEPQLAAVDPGYSGSDSYPSKPGVTSGNWEKEWDARFGTDNFAICAVLFHNPSEVAEWIRGAKDFIRQTLTQARTEVLNEVRKKAMNKAEDYSDSPVDDQWLINVNDLNRILDSLETGMDEKEGSK